ncbi:MAG TPA: 3-deoxy-8-phosphooctulonate synthase [Candidatus Kapabacteria bacterium]|nr:3-deoxy-8-phosphooctulonate synthase [Candidatus Kapabacteria bacterium]
MRIASFDPAIDFFFIAGPCLVEGEEMMRRTAGELAELAARFAVPLVLKGSYRKANRTSVHSVSSIGDERALEILAATGAEFGLPTITDIHVPEDAARASAYVDVLQIPAFLFRQTELLQAAAMTGRAVNIKKGQFAAPDDMRHAVEKVRAAGNESVMVCERGTTFGYHDLVVDMRGLIVMRDCSAPVVYDATHSLQMPSAGATSGGRPEYILPLARAAVAVGVNGVFFETHPDPARALSDAATQLPLERAGQFMRSCLETDRLRRELEGDGNLR